MSEIMIGENEPFVDIVKFSRGRILADMKYHQAGRPGAVTVAYVRLEAAKRLLKAAELLPKGLRLSVYDAWRPYSVQKDIYDEYFTKLAKDPANKGITFEALHAMTRKFVSYPDRGRKVSYVHGGGGAIDLTIVDEAGNELDMGTGFDDFTNLAETFGLPDEEKYAAARQNRRLLYDVMTAVGFTNYDCEWWHFDYGDSFWAEKTGNEPLYPSVYDEPCLEENYG